ncbi:endonuclease-reverse transcriptase [Elysia marginata]|uniref:Endonuclease-reverse transcriptase n=1 Tax=Elysia marginata TaxID=1093978 RepID=A0AAV4JDN2_9GAST|nr:endonuclease-reverse transcriptase [Elysia marginata]
MVSNLDGPPIIAAEVEYALKKMKSGKAPGLDNISTEMLKAIEFIFKETNKYHGLNIGGRKFNNIRYAGDTVLLTENAEDLQLLGEAVNKHSNDAGLEMNVKKTKTMVITKFPPKATSIKIKGRWRLFGHILRRDSQIPPIQAMSAYFVTESSKFKGRSLTTLPVLLNRDVSQITNSNLQLKSNHDLEHLRSIAQQRDEWTKLTVRIREAAEAPQSEH